MGEVYGSTPHQGWIWRDDRLVEIGGRIGSFADIARDCDPIVLAMFSTDQVEDVVERGLQRVF